MLKILTFSLTFLLLVVPASPSLAYRDGRRGPSHLAPGTRFGRQPLANQPYPYLYPVNPELWRQEQRERYEPQVPPDEADKTPSPEDEKPARKKAPVRPKFIEVK